MTTVLVTGASGYIGGATAQALSREGFQVFGLIRDKKHSAELLKNEITPVVGDLHDLKAVEAIIDQVSVVIDNVMLFGKDGLTFDGNRALIGLLEQSAAKTGNKKRYIYTSGVLVYPDTHNKVLDETDATESAGPLKFRAAFEQEVIRNTKIEGVVVRPAFVYGLSFGHSPIQKWIKANDKGEIEITGNPNKSWGWIHVWDLANLYTLVAGANKALVAGEIFNALDDTRASVGQLHEAFARANGVEGKVVHVPLSNDPKDFFQKLAEKSVQATSEKAKRVLGWKPKHGPLPDFLPKYLNALKAHQATGGEKAAH